MYKHILQSFHMAKLEDMYSNFQSKGKGKHHGQEISVFPKGLKSDKRPFSHQKPPEVHIQKKQCSSRKTVE